MFQKLPKAMCLLRSFILFLCFLALHASVSWALELSELHLPMTRDEADTALSKDFESAVLEDGSIRRTWKLQGKTVFVDFNSETQEAILIAIIYDKAVPRREGVADAHALAGGKLDKDAKWAPPKDAKARDLVRDTFGLQNALRKKLNDKTMLFIETDDKKKRIVRVSLFARMPRTNRWSLKSIDGNAATTTAMGDRWTSEHLTALYKDEERRRTSSPNSPLSSTPTHQAVTSSQDSISSGVQQAATPTHHTAFGSAGRRPARPSHSPVSSTPATPSVSTSQGGEKTRVIILDQGGHASEKATFLVTPPDWLKKAGIENPTWWHYIVLGIVALLVIIMIFRAFSHAASSASCRNNYKKIVRQASPRGNVKIRK